LAWQIKWDDDAIRDFSKIDHTSQKIIRNYLINRIATDDNPRRFGSGLSGDKSGLWRYRVGDYRIICKIKDEVATVLVIKVGHRRNVYDE
jgi:mRNA interferase RelE/StbE